MQAIKTTAQVTLVSRIVAVAIFAVGALTKLRVIPDDTGNSLAEFISGDVFADIVEWLVLGAALFLPSALGWMTKERELPEGVTVSDVVVRGNTPNAVEKAKKLNDAGGAGTTSAFIIGCFALTLMLSGCATQCPITTIPQTGEVTQQASR